VGREAALAVDEGSVREIAGPPATHRVREIALPPPLPLPLPFPLLLAPLACAVTATAFDGRSRIAGDGAGEGVAGAFSRFSLLLPLL
jgi:hypothetical protein